MVGSLSTSLFHGGFSPRKKTDFFRFNKERSLCRKHKLYHPYMFPICWEKPLKFQTWIMSYTRIYIMKYLWTTTLGCKDLGNRKSEFVAKTLFF